MYCPARDEEYNNGDTADLVLDCGGTVSFSESFVYLGSLHHHDLSDHHDVEARIKKASKAFGALRDRFFGSRDVPERLKGKVYAGGVLAVLLYGCESWCLTAASIQRLSLWHNMRIREMCRVTMRQTFIILPPKAYNSPLASLNCSITSRAAHCSGSDTSRACPRAVSLSISCCRGWRSRASSAAKR